MEFRFLLTLITLLGGIWLYLYRVILDLTVGSFNYATQMFLGFMHYIVLCYLALTLYSFFHYGLNDGEPPKGHRSQMAAAIVLETWPVTLVVLCFSFCVTKIWNSDTGSKSTLVILSASAVAYIVYRARKPKTDGGNTKLTTDQIMWFYGNIAIFTLPYLLIMSILLADVQITTDKDFYTQKDPVIISIRASGYLFRPTIKKISMGSYEANDPGDATLMIPPEAVNGDDTIKVDYQPQAWFWTRSQFHVIKVVKTHRQ